MTSLALISRLRLCIHGSLPGKSVRSVFTTAPQCSDTRASISRPNRHSYARMYETVLVQPDGSTINIRYREPRGIIKLPEDVSQLSETQKMARLARRKPKEKIVVEEEIEDTFDSNQYSHLWKKK